jgi:hypothetical protein
MATTFFNCSRALLRSQTPWEPGMGSQPQFLQEFRLNTDTAWIKSKNVSRDVLKPFTRSLYPYTTKTID